MKRRVAAPAIAALLVAGLALAGCGSDDKKTATTTTGGGARLTKAQYIAAADRICKATTAKIETEAAKLRESAEKSGTIPVPRVTRFLKETSLPAYEAMLEELRMLTPPKQDEKTIDGFIAALASAIDMAKANPAKYARSAAQDPFDDANRRAIDYGMKICGS